MGKERIKYLTPKQQQSIENWAVDIGPLWERHPVLNNVDLVIEGGVGNGRTMPHIVRALFPKALYIGIDLSPTLATYTRSWQVKKIHEKALQKVLNANKHPDLEMQEAIIFGNCFDIELIRDIHNKTGCKFPFLVSYNALSSLLDRKMNLWEIKSSEDIYSAEKIVSPESPYVGQLHIIHDYTLLIEDGLETCIKSDYRRLEMAAKNSGWITDRIDYGLLILQTNSF